MASAPINVGTCTHWCAGKGWTGGSQKRKWGKKGTRKGKERRKTRQGKGRQKTKSPDWYHLQTSAVLSTCTVALQTAITMSWNRELGRDVTVGCNWLCCCVWYNLCLIIQKSSQLYNYYLRSQLKYLYRSPFWLFLWKNYSEYRSNCIVFSGPIMKISFFLR